MPEAVRRRRERPAPLFPSAASTFFVTPPPRPGDLAYLFAVLAKTLAGSATSTATDTGRHIGKFSFPTRKNAVFAQV